MNKDLLHKRLGDWIAELELANPNLEDGESMSIEFSAGRVGYDDDEEPLFSVSIETKRVENPV